MNNEKMISRLDRAAFVAGKVAKWAGIVATGMQLAVGIRDALSTNGKSADGPLNSFSKHALTWGNLAVSAGHLAGDVSQLLPKRVAKEVAQVDGTGHSSVSMGSLEESEPEYSI